jgi:beta-glucanase (GH16 family)
MKSHASLSWATPYRLLLTTGTMLIFGLGLVLLLNSRPILAAPPCGTPKGGPCPTATPGSDPTPTPEQPTATPVSTATPAPTATPGSGSYVLVWSDEFNGTGIDLNNWTFDIGWGQNGWGNAELQYYTDRPQNARVENGMLVIEARKERFRAQEYTSARLKTQGLHDWTYGRFEARIRVPYGQGIWPAFWTLGNNIETVGWPQSGELDIMEHIGREPSTVYGTVHGPGYSGAEGVGGSYTLSGGQQLTDAFHLFAVEWEPTEISWYIDNTLYATVTPDDVPGEWVFDHPFFIIMNVAVGGYWPGYPDETTVFPQFMYVDYVRVYQK